MVIKEIPIKLQDEYDDRYQNQMEAEERRWARECIEDDLFGDDDEEYEDDMEDEE